eukprot:c10886_g1_i2.p1 GENE.c10886_g1_i2~~c10886_g1_i2.p1  ORF type:complete len:267 (+),score=34.23 c10886_g1_i2:38-802(+)
MNDKTRVLLVRHGQTTLDEEERFQGSANPELTHQGRVEAHQLGRLLRSRPDTSKMVVFSSDFKRCTETASYIAAQISQRVQDPEIRLRGRSYGPLEGLTESEANEKFPALLQNLSNWYFVGASEGIESRAHLSQRGITLLNELVNQPHLRGKTLVLVTHSDWISAVYRDLIGVPRQHPDHVFFNRACVSEFSVSGDGSWVAHSIADISHQGRAGQVATSLPFPLYKWGETAFVVGVAFALGLGLGYLSGRRNRG